MGHRTHAAQLLFVFVLSTSALIAQAAIYRCGANYQDTPCAGGRTIEAEDARSAQQQQDARSAQQQQEAARAVQKDAAMGEALRKQRIQEEAQQAKQQQAAQKAYLAQEAEAAKEAKAQAALAAKAEGERQKALKPRTITTRKAPLPKASATQGR
jgi:preprotein translocase subunit SecF